MLRSLFTRSAQRMVLTCAAGHCPLRRQCPWIGPPLVVPLAVLVLALVGCREQLPPLADVVQTAATATAAAAAGSSADVAAAAEVESTGGRLSPGQLAPGQLAPGQLALGPRIDRVLEQQLQGRVLSVREQGAWQVLHGVLAYQQRFPVVVDAEGGRQSAVAYLLEGGTLGGWTFAAGDLNSQTGRRGLRAIVEPGTKIGQGHYDQWLAILAQCDLPLDTPMQLAGGQYQLQDLVWQVQHDAPRNVIREFSWTLIGLTRYLPTDGRWTAADGREWSIEGMVASELQQEVDGGACGGTHRLIGLAMARNQHLQQGRAARGVWSDVTVLLERYVALAQQLQNPDGTFSTRFFLRPSSSWDVGSNLAATGHVLEFLALALPAQRLRDSWVQAAVEELCTLLESTAGSDLECGALYHALHGLVLYRQRTATASDT